MLNRNAALPLLLNLLCFFAVSAAVGQVTVSSDAPAYLDAASAKVYQFGDRVLIEAEGLKPQPLAGAKIKVDRADKYLILAFKKNPTEIAALINLEPNLYLLPGKAGDVYLIIIAPLDGSPQSFHEVVIPGGASPPPPPVDPPPGGGDFSKLQTLAKDEAAKVGDPVVAKALGTGFVQLRPTLDGKTLADAKMLVKQHTLLVMESRPIDPAAQKDWRPFLLAIDAAINALKITDSKTYAAAIHAIGLGILEAAK